MADSKTTPGADTAPRQAAHDEAKGHFAKAVEEAKAGAQALGKEAQHRADGYREKANQAGEEWSARGKEKTGEAKDMAYGYANQGKAKATEGLNSLGRMVGDQASVIDEKVGVEYGNYARSAAATIQDTAARLDEKSLEDLGDDAREFVREKPAMAIGLAAAAGYMLARLFRR